MYMALVREDQGKLKPIVDEDGYIIPFEDSLEIVEYANYNEIDGGLLRYEL